MRIVIQKNQDLAWTVCFSVGHSKKETVIAAQIERYYFKAKEIIPRNYKLFDKLAENDSML